MNFKIFFLMTGFFVIDLFHRVISNQYIKRYALKEIPSYTHCKIFHSNLEECLYAMYVTRRE